MSTSNHQNRPTLRERRKKLVRFFKALSCFGSKKGENRIVPDSRIPEWTVPNGQSTRSQATGWSNRSTTLPAPPSSPASFSLSPAPSIAQSPRLHLALSANSPGGPSSAMFATGPYAHETQLVSPPAFSTYTTEPSTAPLTPPPELAHHTTPSSPEVPYARFLTSSSADLKKISRITGDGRSTSFPDREFSPQWDPLASPRTVKGSRSGSSYSQTPETNTTTPKATGNSNFFCPATFARYYLDHDAPFSHTGGRLSVSKEPEVHRNSGGNGQRISKQDMEEIEAYRASFGFSADEVITEITHVNDDSLRPRSSPPEGEGRNSYGSDAATSDLQRSSNLQEPLQLNNDHMRRSSTPGNGSQAKTSRKYKTGMCSSDAEVDYRRSGRSFSESRGDFACHD